MNGTDGTGPGAHELAPEERTWGMLAHLSALIGMAVPLGNVIAPLVIWLTRREQSEFVGDQAKESLNFNLSALIAAFVCGMLAWLLIGLPLLALLGLYWLIMTIVAGIRAGEGIRFRHPLTLRLVA